MTPPRPDPSVLQQRPIGEWPWPRIVLFVPLPPALPFVDEVFWQFMAIASQGIPFMRHEYGRTDFVRNKAVETLLQSDYTHILMLDSDHIHPAQIVQRLARWVIADPAKQVIGGLNFKRSEPYDPCAFVKVSSNGRDEYAYPQEWYPGLMEVDLIGTGSILIAREVFEAIEPPYFWYSYSNAAQGLYPSDDIGFSLKCQAAGIKMYVDTTTTSPHMVARTVTEQTFRDFWASQPEPELVSK